MRSLPIDLNDKTIIPKFIFGATVLILAVLSAMEHTDVLVEVLESQNKSAKHSPNLLRAEGALIRL